MDAFADLSISKKKNDVAGMTLLQRQEHLRKQQQSQQPQSTPSAWGGLDLMSQGLKESEAGASRNSSGNGNGNGIGLLDLDISTAAGPSTSTSASDNIDELFDVFNKPPEPKQVPVTQEAQITGPEDVPSFTSGDDPEEKPARSGDPRDRSIAELVDMGFSPEQAKTALANTDTGLNVAQAVDYIMNEAHRRSRPRRNEQSNVEEQDRDLYRSDRNGSNEDRGRMDRTEPDLAKIAQDLSANILSKANSLWSQGRKNLAKAIEQYSQSGEANDGTPAWMRDSHKYVQREQHRPESDIERSARYSSATEEAARLDMERPDRKQRPDRSDTGGPMHPRWQDNAVFDVPRPSSLPQMANSNRAGRPPASESHANEMPPRPSSASSAPSRDSPISRAQQFKQRGLIDDDEPVYVSSARRRPAAPASASASTPASPAPSVARSQAPARSQSSRPQRAPISISPTALQMATSSREAGKTAFVRGDYAQAAVSFSQALDSVPPKHLLRTILLSNRAACYQRTGDSRAVVTDTTEGLLIIGPGMGVGEEVEPGKPLKDIWAKLVTHQAEAYEHMEKFQESLDSWNLLLLNGHSNKTSLDGKRRCQAALAPKPKPKPKPQTANTFAGPTSKEGRAAVERVRNQQLQEERFDTEKYVLLDSVEARVSAWRHGKEDNLRALLGSLDTILWPELQWKTVSMAELIVPKKVKLSYMKAVAKTHPDKISPDATTEHKMIAQAVFVTLNKSWDLFKEANGLQ